jgi:hypothetical protein
LKAALLRLQGWDSKENYWIDALCIDQLNFDERSDQVLLMGDIYSQCKFVFIWLGEEESTYSARALSFIRKWADLDRVMEVNSMLFLDLTVKRPLKFGQIIIDPLGKCMVTSYMVLYLSRSSVSAGRTVSDIRKRKHTLKNGCRLGCPISDPYTIQGRLS